MSTAPITSLRKALRYNARAISRLNLVATLPQRLLDDHGVTEINPDTVRALAFAFQSERPELFEMADGLLGPATLKAMLKAYSPLSADYWTFNILRSPASSELRVVSYDQQGGLDLHSVGHFTPRWFSEARKPTQIVVHWGGLNPKHLFNAFSGARKVSSHVGVGLDGNEAVAYQYLNLMHKAWHAGSANGYSIGIDICQQPDTKWASHYDKTRYAVREIDNPSSRGPSRCLSLDPRVAEATNQVIKDLCFLFDIPLQTPDTDEVLADPKSFRGVVGHHHLSHKKWDCAPWWSEITEGLNRRR